MKRIDAIIRGSPRLSALRDEQPLIAWHEAMPPTIPGLKTDTPALLDQGERLPDPRPLPEPPPADWRTVALPPRMHGLKRDHRGYPVFFTVAPQWPMPEDGVRVDFRVIRLERHTACMEKRLCGVCGTRLGAELWFVGGPMCIQNRIFGDAPMHQECARYAMRVCPHLSIAPKGYRTTDHADEKREGGLYLEDPNASLVKPQRVVIYICRDYHVTRAPLGKDLYMVPPGGVCEWFDIDGTYRCRTRPTGFSQ